MTARIIKNAAIVTLPTVALMLFAFELLFRFAVPASEAPYAYYDRSEQILRLDARANTSGVYTLGSLAQQRGRWRVNNYGWNSEIDYLPYHLRTRPLIAIIGDSYVEAFQVNVEDSTAGVLRRLAGNDYDVYSFGTGGAPLSQYLQMSRYVTRHFRPEIIVFNVVHNDFLESMRQFVRLPYFLTLTYEDNSFREVPPTPYKPNARTRLLGKSALWRYFWHNLRVAAAVRNFRRRDAADDFNANVDVRETMANSGLIRELTFFVIKRIRDENPDTTLIFMIDAPRKDIYSGRLSTSNVRWMHDALKAACARNGAHFVDLTGPFAEKFKKDGVKFESVYDAHWNDVGHKLAAQVLHGHLKTLLLNPR